MNSYRRQRETSAPITEWNGFSVVAPMSVTRPDSTTGRSASCWVLLKRWISSMKSTVRCPCAPSRSRALAITACTSAFPEETAESSSNTDCVPAATIRASVVLPVPGGPKKSDDETRSSSIARRSAAPSPTSWGCPANSSSARGRRRSASGAWAARRSSAASSNRLTEGL